MQTARIQSTFKILVVDDEPLLRSLIQQKFKNQIKAKEFSFSFASNGVEALKILEEESDIGIILLDLNMPVMNGFALLEHFSTKRHLYRVIIVTAYGDMINIRRAMNQGASDFVTKPIDLEDLERTLNRNMEYYQAIKEASLAHENYLKMAKEIEIAKNIQLSLIPSNFHGFDAKGSVELHGEVIPIQAMGGNFFDFFKLDENRMGFFIGAVAEKGIPAALFMMITRTLLRTLALNNNSPAECFEKINKLLLVKEVSFAIYVTAFYGILDLKTGSLTYCNAGHLPPVMIAKDGSIKEIGRYEGIALAITDDPIKVKGPFQEKELKFEKNDSIVLYTNGVIETEDPSRELFSEARLKEFFQNCTGLSPRQIVEGLKNELKAFSKNVEPISDVSIFAIRYNGS